MKFRQKKSEPQQQPLLTEPTSLPVGSFVQTESGDFYISGINKRLRIPTKRILDSWSPQRVIKATEEAVSRYKVTAKLKFRNGSLLRDVSDGKIYLIENGLKRHLVSPEAFNNIGVDFNNVDRYATPVSKEELSLHALGDELA